MGDMGDFIDKAFEKNMKIMTGLYKQIGDKNPYVSALLISAIFDGVSLGYCMLGDNYPLNAMEKRIIEDYCTPPKKKGK
jgi:hypothetical protein